MQQLDDHSNSSTRKTKERRKKQHVYYNEKQNKSFTAKVSRKEERMLHNQPPLHQENHWSNKMQLNFIQLLQVRQSSCWNSGKLNRVLSFLYQLWQIITEPLMRLVTSSALRQNPPAVRSPILTPSSRPSSPWKIPIQNPFILHYITLKNPSFFWYLCQ